MRVLRWLAAAQIIALAAALAAIALAVVSLDDVNGSRRAARFDTCNLLVGLVDHAAPASRRPDLDAFIAGTPLRNCHIYARDLN